MALYDYQTLVDELVRDDAGRIAAPERDRAIGLAVGRYGKDRPRVVVEDVSADGTNILPLPASWVADKTYLASLEYPVGEYPVSIIDQELLGVVRTPAGQEIRLVGAIANGDTVRATIHLPHTLNTGADTLPESDREAVASYAAALLLDQLASLYAANQDSTIQADSVDHRSQSAEYAARARALRARYFDALGIDPKRQVAASATVNLNLADSQGRDRLTHPARRR